MLNKATGRNFIGTGEGESAEWSTILLPGVYFQQQKGACEKP
jgi:hypothetical protein